MAAVTTAVIAGATAAYTVASSEDQKRKARAEQTKAKDDAAQAERDADKRETTEKERSSASAERQKRLKRQRSIAAEKQGRQGTILAGGEVSGGGQSENLGSSQGKSLLGV